MYSNFLYYIKAQNEYIAYHNREKRSEKMANLPEIVSFMYQKAHKMSAVSKWQCYFHTMCTIWSVSRSSNRILLQPFDSVFISCELTCGIE